MSAGRAGERERFVRDFLRHHEAQMNGPPKGPFTAEFSPALSRRVGAKRLDLVFHVTQLAEHPGAQLMVPGNPYFDRLLRLARRGGGFSRRYLRRDRGREPQRQLAATGPLASAEFGEPVYRAQLLFTFKVAYRATDGFDDIRSILVTPGSGRTEGGRSFFLYRNLSEEPELDIRPAPPVDAEAALADALAELERRITPVVARFTLQAQDQLNRETERLRVFYQALIEEEKVRRTRRVKSSPATVAATGSKVEWLKRLEREIRLFAPRVTVTLLGLEEIWVPCSPFIVGSGGASAKGELDLATGEILGLACQVCGAELPWSASEGIAPVRGCSRDHLVCSECLEQCATCRNSFCLLCSGPPGVADAQSACYSRRSRDSVAESACPSCGPSAGRA